MLALFEKVLYIYEVITFDCKENGTYMRRIIIMKEKVVLAYSGGLDTTAIIPWLKETFDYDVICCCIDCGQGEELAGHIYRNGCSTCQGYFFAETTIRLDFYQCFRYIAFGTFP